MLEESSKYFEKEASKYKFEENIYNTVGWNPEKFAIFSPKKHEETYIGI